jgi:DNA-binding response OmpR family regulator
MSARMQRILIVEDDKSISDLVQMNLTLVGYECDQAKDGDEGRRLANKTAPDLVLLDIMLPGADGFTLMEQGVFGGVPVIFLTAKDGVADRVKGLRLGADDYIVKPFEAAELIARVAAVLRRTSPSGDNTYTFGDTVINVEARTATVGGEDAGLTNMEFRLLEALIRNKNLAVSREKLLDLAWGYDFCGDTRTVDVHITKLRKKLHMEDHIKTVYKHGYRFDAQ